MLKIIAIGIFCLFWGGAASAAQPATAPHRQLPRISVRADGRGFVTGKGKAFVPFGLTYFRPNTGWAPQVWKRFDAEATRQDFTRMQKLGINCVRVFLSFGSFYSEPGKLDADGLAKFDEFLAIAEEHGIYVHPTGPDHWEGLPDWAKVDRYADETVLVALEKFWSLFAARYRDRKVIFAYDLLNEPHIAWDTPPMRAKWNAWLQREYRTAPHVAYAWKRTLPPGELGEFPVPRPVAAAGSRELLDYQRFREEVADEWTRRQAVVLKAADPKALVTVGYVQWSVPSLMPGVQHYAAARPARQAQWLDFLEIHFYPLDSGAYDYRSEEEENRNLAYAHGVVAEVAKLGKPVVLAEFGWYGGGKPRFDGGKHPFASEEQQAQWCRRLVETTAGLACGWLNWGLYDQPEATDPSEFSGLLTATGETKAWGREFEKLAKRYTKKLPATKQLKPGPELDWNTCVTDPAAGNRWRSEYFEKFTAASGRK